MSEASEMPMPRDQPLHNHGCSGGRMAENHPAMGATRCYAMHSFSKEDLELYLLRNLAVFPIRVVFGKAQSVSGAMEGNMSAMCWGLFLDISMRSRIRAPINLSQLKCITTMLLIHYRLAINFYECFPT